MYFPYGLSFSLLCCFNNNMTWLKVLEFQKGRLQNLYWKRDGCASCSGKSNFVCLNKQDCAIRTSSCKNRGGSVDCSIGIQLAFSGTDRHLSVLNSWYEVANLRQYSLYGLYSNLKDSLTSQYNSLFWLCDDGCHIFVFHIRIYLFDRFNCFPKCNWIKSSAVNHFSVIVQRLFKFQIYLEFNINLRCECEVLRDCMVKAFYTWEIN